ncbi:hypothetical protein [Pseudarthrobacter sp. N5]
MTTATPEPTSPAPLTFQAPPPEAPGQPNPIPRGIPWDEPITPDTKVTAP